MSQICVNRSSKAFKSLAKELNVSENQLELLAHQYNMSVGNAEAFLTDAGKSWLREQLAGQVTEVGQSVHDLWARKFKKPHVYNKYATAKAAYDNTVQLFPKDAVVLTETHDGKYTLSVREPNVSTTEYEHRSPVEQAMRIVEEARESLSKPYSSANDYMALRQAVNSFNERLRQVLSPRVQVAAGYLGMREGTAKLRLLQEVADLEKPASREELNNLFATLSSKFTKPFKVVKGNKLSVRDAGNYYEVQVVDGTLPSYTQLAEEMLHPIMDEIQRYNKELFDQFLQEVLSTKDAKLKVITDGIMRSYKDQSIAVQNNEIVTQAAAYMMQIAEPKQTSTFKKILNAIAKWLNENGFLKGANPVFSLQNFAYILKFENVQFHLTGMQREYEHRMSDEALQTQFLQEQQTFFNQLQTIQNSGRLSSTEVRQVAASVSYAVSDLITDFQEGRRNLSEFTGKETTKDISQMSRAEILQFIGVDNAFDFVAKNYFGNLQNIKTPKDRLAATTIYQNFDAIKELSAEEFVNVEGFGLKFTQNRETEVIEDLHINVDDINNEEDAAAVIEREGDLQEHWQVNFRTIDVLGSMSQLVRQALLKCYKLDKQGNPITNRFGIRERVSAREATGQILRWTQGAIDLDHMIYQLREHQSDNPWIGQIIQRLQREDKTQEEYGADTDFRSQFFSVFNKHFQTYTVGIKDKDGKFFSKTVNEHPALTDIINQLQVMTAMNEVPMFEADGINSKALGIFHNDVESLLSVNEEEFNNLTPETTEDLQDSLWDAFMELGLNLTTEQIQSNWTYENYTAAKSALFHIDNTLTKNRDNKEYDPFEFKGGIKGNLSAAIAPFIANLEDVAVSSFYDNGKTYQSYVTPSYLTKFMQKMKLRGEEFDAFVESEFGKFGWFKNEQGWRHPWLRAIVEKGDRGFKVNGVDYRDILSHHVQLNFNKKGYMRQMSPAEYTMSVMSEFFSYNGESKDPVTLAWYRVPMLSNKPSSEFIRFTRYADLATYKENVLNDIMDVFFQELSRIQTTKARNKVYPKGSPEFIKNLDKNGSKFNFLPYLNAVEGQFKTLVERKTNGEALTIAEEAQLNELARNEIRKYMNERAERILAEWEAQGIMDAAQSIKGINSNNVRAQLENFIWNDNLATMMIEELFVTDIALYKNTEDLQKRLAQIHAPGVRGDVKAVDYEGNTVSDGTYRTIILTDFDDFISNVIENVQEVFSRREEGLEGSNLAAAKAIHEAIVDGFRHINVADAQGYSCPTSRRKKDLIMGLWSRDKESMYKRIVNGNYTEEDLKKIFNMSMANEPEKPFCYSQIEKSTGVNAGLPNYKLGVQYKNSEYMLMLADAILQNERTGRPNLLRAIYNFMEDSAFSEVERAEGKVIARRGYTGKGIDTIQFESTAKALVQGAVNIKQFQYAEGGETLAYNELNQAAYNEDGSYNLTRVHEVPFEDWCLQQPVPNHFYDHAQAQGSQTRMIIPSSLEHYWDGQETKFKVYDDEFSATEFREAYENLIAQNIQESLNEVAEELGLNSTNTLERNIAIAKVLQREIKSSPRYGTDLLKACTLDANGEFIIPLGDPIQAKRIEQLLNSIIKNRVNKQEIAGGPIVQVSNFGTSRELNIRFNSKDGGLLATKAEFAEEARNRGLSEKALDQAYKDYVHQNQAGIAYYEVFAPRFEGIELFEDKFGNIDMEAIERECPEILEMICYRIPTEDKYSITPCKVVGFLPKEAGAGIMMPNDITLLTGSDFDVDKMYSMRKEFVIKRDGNKRIVEVPHGNDTRIGRNNRIVEMTRSVLTHESNADKVLNPGGFEPQKRMGYMVEAYKHNAASWDQLQGIADGRLQVKSNGDGTFTIEKINRAEVDSGKAETGVDALKSLSYQSSDLGFIDTQIQFYKQNSAAGSILAIFAVAKVAHAVMEDNQLRLMLNNPTEMGGIGLTAPLSIAGFQIGSPADMSVEIDPVKDSDGGNIGKALGSLVASAADAVKDPVLNLMNINKETVNVLNTLVRFGMPFDKAALFLSQKVITDTLQEFYRENLAKNTFLSEVVEKKMKELGDAGTAVTEDIREEKLVEGISSTKDEKHSYQVLYAFSKVLSMANALRGVNFATRFNSVSSAVGPLVIDNIIKVARMKPSAFSQIFGLGDEGIAGIFAMHPILSRFAATLDTARELFADMPEYSGHFRDDIEDGINYVPKDFSQRVMEDRDLLGKYSDFFKSYVVLAAGIVKPSELNRFVNEFAAEFTKYKKDEKYKDNPLIQHLKVAKDKDGTLYIKADSGVLNDQTLKEDLMAAWTDLIKDNKALAVDLFKYCFFRGGIGFTPRTFMSLVPVELKLAIDGYAQAFRDADATIDRYTETNGSVNLADQFVQNNWQNAKLVPTRELKEDTYYFDKRDGSLYIMSEECTLPYFKVKNEDGSFIIYKRNTDNTTSKYINYTTLQTLGGNGEYVEFYTGESSSYERLQKKATETELNITTTSAEELFAEQNATYEEDAAHVEPTRPSANIVDEVTQTQRAKEGLEALGIENKDNSSIVDGVTDAVAAKVPAVTKEAVDKLKDKQNNC